MDENDGKDLLLSKAVHGIIVAGVISIGKMLDIDLVEGDVANIVLFVALVYAVWGRKDASKRITSIGGVRIK